MKDNKLIAEFMGVDTQILSTGNIHSWSDAPFFYITEDSKEKVMEGIAKYSKYHESWDWLMPVVDKCYTSNMQHPNDNITQGLIDVDIKATYQAVVEFIKEYNADSEDDACDMLYGVDNNQ